MRLDCVQLLLFCYLFSSTVHCLDFALKRYNRRVAPNSVIDISRVGRAYKYRSWYSYYGYTRYTNEGPLVCRTDNHHCCRDVDDPFENEENGEWYYPNGQVVGSSQQYNKFYVTRGHQELLLHSYSAYSPTGVYCCDIQSVNGSGNITAEYVSPTNYSYVNSSTTECVGLYSYSQLRLCPELSVNNGWVTYDSPYIPGRVATVSCSSGFSVIGNSRIACTNRGWSESRPSCAYDCGPLSNPENGRVDTSSGTTAGRVATYSCNEGYHLVGSASRYCQYSRRGYYYNQYINGWSDSVPYCADDAKVQLKFSPSTNCLEWDVSTASRVESSLRGAIIQVLSDFFGEEVGHSHNVSLSSNLRPGFFSCRFSQKETTYRTTIIGLEDISAHTLVRVIQKWVSSSPSVRLQWYVVDINKHCPVAIQSDFEPECESHPKILDCIESCYGVKV